MRIISLVFNARVSTTFPGSAPGGGSSISLFSPTKRSSGGGNVSSKKIEYSYGDRERVAHSVYALIVMMMILAYIHICRFIYESFNVRRSIVTMHNQSID